MKEEVFKKMKKNFIAFCLIISFFTGNAAFSAQVCSPNTCYSGKYPVSNVFSRGIQRIFGLNILTTKIAEMVIKKEISKQIQKGKIKVHLKTYSAGDLIAGKIKDFELSGKNLSFQDIYLSEVNAKNICKFTYFDYKSKPAQLKSPLYVKYSAKITNNDLDKTFSSNLIKNSLSGIKIKLGFLEIGQADIANIKSSASGGKIKMQADLVYRGAFSIQFPVSFETSLKTKDDKIFLTHFKFARDMISRQFWFITDSIELNNVCIVDLKNIEEKGAKIGVNKIQIDDKISVEGTLWQPENTTF